MHEEISDEDRMKAKEVIAKFAEKKDIADIFYNLCFCICAPQAPFSKNRLVIQELRERDFWNNDIKLGDMQKIVRPVRFLRKAEYLILMKLRWDKIFNVINSDMFYQHKREWLVKNVKGIGMKAASHFLRNMGATNLAIIDTHVLKFLQNAPAPKRNTEYLVVEQIFGMEAAKRKMSIAELDACVWKMYSGTEWSEFVY